MVKSSEQMLDTWESLALTGQSEGEASIKAVSPSNPCIGRTQRSRVNGERSA